MKIFKKLFSLIKNDKEIDIRLGGGLLGIGEKDTDYILGGDDVLTILKSKEDLNRQPIYEYNQGALYETRNYCTIYSAITELSYLFDYKFTLCQIREIANRMIQDKKLDPNAGAYLSDAIDYTRKWWNENFPDKKVSSYRISYLDETLRNELIHGKVRLTQLGYRTSTDLYNEIQSRGYAMGADYPKVGGHAVSQYGLNIIDNYKGKNNFNRYSFHNFYDLVRNGVIFENGYIFLKD